MNGELQDRNSGVPHLEELDLVIHNMDTETTERSVEAILKVLPGVAAARILGEGVWLRYDPAQITKEIITKSLHQSGFRAGVFQDSLSGKTGVAS